MARVSVEQDLPQIGKPVGSKQEIEKLGLPTRNIATCSPHTHDNRGCSVYEFCDRVHQNERPKFEIVRRTSAAGVRVYHAPCFDIVPKEYTANDNNELYEVIGGEGDTYFYRGSKKKHETRDPDCNECAAGKCATFIDVDNLEMKCPEFPPASTHKELQKFARVLAARNQSSIKQRAAIKASLLGGEDSNDDEGDLKRHKGKK